MTSNQPGATTPASGPTIAAVAGHDLYAPPPRPRPRNETGISRRQLLRLRLTDAAREDIDYDGTTRGVRAGWDRDGHERLLRALEPVAGVMAELAALEPGMRVLDVGAGDGNLALACAHRGTTVDACDLAPTMVRRGRARCPAARWTVADAQALPYADDVFDAVLSTFGAVLAPQARRTAQELVRVARPGGLVGLTAWVPRGLPGRLDELVEALAPLPTGVRSPQEWGRQEVVRRRLSRALEDVELRLRTISLRFESADALFETLLAPTPLTAAQREALRPDLDRLLASCNDAPAPAVALSARYLVALGRRPA